MKTESTTVHLYKNKDQDQEVKHFEVKVKAKVLITFSVSSGDRLWCSQCVDL